MITALLLAAGSGRRFGGAKLLQALDGKAVVRWTAEALRHALIAELVVVVPPHDDAVRSALDGLSPRFVVNPDPDLGMGTSIARGVAALSPSTDAVLVAVADTPGLNPLVIDRVVARHRAHGSVIVVPLYNGARGHPVLFPRIVFPELLTLSGDRGARAITDRDPGRVTFLEQHEPPPLDVDTMEDLARLRRQGHHMRSSTS